MMMQTDPNVTPMRSEARVRRARLWAALAVGIILGAVLRPYAGQIWRWSRVSATPPQPKLANLYRSKCGQFRLLDPSVDAGSVVYLGDSITDWMLTGEFLRFDRGRVVNRAISGDTTAGVLERVGESFPEDAAACVLMIGFNDLDQGATPGDTAKRIESLSKELLSRYRTGHVVVESVLPASEAVASSVAELNGLLRAMADGDDGLSFLDLHGDFLTDGRRDESFYAGDVHLNARGVVLRLEREIAHLGAVAGVDLELVSTSER
jgi:lysophospholipase L1-like esterase